MNIIEIIKDEFALNGYKGAAKKLEISIYKLKKIIEKHNLKLSRKRRVDISNFENINKKEVAYFLGFFWSDGYISKDEISISIKSSDSNSILNVLNKFGNWRINNRIKKLNGKEFNSSCIRINDRYIKHFLIEHDYDKKSLTSPTKILNKIPNKIKPYFFRGLIDGDGCFCSKNRNYFSITGNINQNWLEIHKLFNNLEIKYKLTKKERTTGNSSYVVISSRKDITKLGNYIYGVRYDNIGLERKYKVYKEIFNKEVSKYSKCK